MYFTFVRVTIIDILNPFMVMVVNSQFYQKGRLCSFVGLFYTISRFVMKGSIIVSGNWNKTPEDYNRIRSSNQSVVKIEAYQIFKVSQMDALWHRPCCTVTLNSN